MESQKACDGSKGFNLRYSFKLDNSNQTKIADLQSSYHKFIFAPQNLTCMLITIDVISSGNMQVIAFGRELSR